MSICLLLICSSVAAKTVLPATPLRDLLVGGFEDEASRHLVINKNDCPAPANDDPCDTANIATAKTEYSQGITDLKASFDDLECEDKSASSDDEDNAKYEACIEMKAAWCKLEAGQADFIEKLDTSCAAVRPAADMLAKVNAFLNGKSNTALDPITSEEMCSFNSVIDYTNEYDAIFNFGATIIAFDALIGVLSAIQGAVGDITFFGSPAAAVLAGVIGVLIAIKAILEGLQLQKEEAFTLLGVNDDDCVANHVFRIQQNNYESFKLQEDFFDFLAFPYGAAGGRTKVGGGCDGIDNDGDSVVLGSFSYRGDDLRTSTIGKRVDECDEDLVPPTIILSLTPPTYFITAEHARKWYDDNIIFVDDCVPTEFIEKTVTVTSDSNPGEITVRVEDRICRDQATERAIVDGNNIIVNGPGAYFAEKIFRFVLEACPLLPFLGPRPLIGEGCDGLDNDCDSSFIDAMGNQIPAIRRVDECDEDRVPPTITLAKDSPASFLTQEQAVKWFNDNTVVSDDCVPSHRLEKTHEEVTNTGRSRQITFNVADQRCVGNTELVATVNGQADVVVDGRGEPEATKTFQFIVDECPYLPYSIQKPDPDRDELNGEGCDGFDNDCDSNFLNADGNEFELVTKRVDECDEDRVPPTITLVKEPPRTFPSLNEAVAFFMENTEEEDDCIPLDGLTKSSQNAQVDPAGSGSVEIVVVTPCERLFGQARVTGTVNGVSDVVVDGPGAFQTVKTFTFEVDGTGPTVTCGFHKPQDINHVQNDPNFVPDGLNTPPIPQGDADDPLHIDYYYERKDLVNVELWYSIVVCNDDCCERLHFLHYYY